MIYATTLEVLLRQKHSCFFWSPFYTIDFVESQDRDHRHDALTSNYFILTRLAWA